MSLSPRRLHTSAYFFRGVAPHFLFQDGTCQFPGNFGIPCKMGCIQHFGRDGNASFKKFKAACEFALDHLGIIVGLKWNLNCGALDKKVSVRSL